MRGAIATDAAVIIELLIADADGDVEVAIVAVFREVEDAEGGADLMRVEIGDLVGHEVRGGIGLLFEGLIVALELLIHGVEEDAVSGAEDGCRQGEERRDLEGFHKI